MYATNHNAFVLSAQVGDVPAGATGQLSKPDSYHVTLTFDNPKHEDLVFDLYDTDPSVWAAIRPSMTDPPLFGWRRMAAVALIAFLAGWLSLPQPQAIAQAEASIIGVNSD
jgi:hypothetical protein